MQIVGRPAQIKDLPHYTIDDQVPRAVYCLLLSMSPINAQFYQLRTTDFTNHPLLKTQYDERVLSDCFIDKDLIACIDIHKSKWKSAVNASREQFSSDIEQPAETIKLIDELVFCKLTLKSKTYNNVLEPRVMYIEFVGRYCNDSYFLQLLDSVLTELPFECLMSHRDKFKRRFPPDTLNKWQAIIETRERKLRNVTQAESQIKTEGDTTRSLAIEFSDLEVSDDDLNVVGNQWKRTRKRSIEGNNSVSKRADALKKSTRQISIRDLQLLDDSDLLNQTYIVEGQIVDTFPQDWSFVCVKSYVHRGNSYEYSDPMLRDVEFVIADNEGGHLSVWLDSNQMQILFDKLVEVIFCESSQLQALLFKENNFEIIRSNRKVGSSLVPLWSFTETFIRRMRHQIIKHSEGS